MIIVNLSQFLTFLFPILSPILFPIADIEMKSLVAPLESGKLIETDPTNSLQFDVSAIATDTSNGIVGDNLWQVTLFGSQDAEGAGPPIQPQTQVLSSYQSSMGLEPGGQVDYGRVTVNFDMSRLTCPQIGYMCMRLEKSPSASVDFTLQAVPDPSVLVDCNPVDCGGL